MHHLVRLTMASALSGLIGWLLIVLGNSLFALVAKQPPPSDSNFTIINWTISLIISSVAFVIAYIKITNWLET
jgi:hypothetical protein